MRYTHRVELVDRHGNRHRRFCRITERGGQQGEAVPIAGSGEWNRVFHVMSPPFRVNNRWKLVDLTDGRQLYDIEAVETTPQRGRRIRRAVMDVYARRTGNRSDPAPDHAVWAVEGAVWTVDGATWGYSP